ncbi:XapX domain-containing protein [Halorarius litoreus]|uniref:XapX domain-containing protein n=1 Tax=Halorarius litoreus TaxID=2962676 RepID=UPI0020CF33B4|nr:DUF1427 family protein [Halorarius litoreus]
MNVQLGLALLTGVLAGGCFSVIEVPIPAPPNPSGILGIIGIYLGYRDVEWAGVHVDVAVVLSSVEPL